jgi:hypothetical protein
MLLLLLLLLLQATSEVSAVAMAALGGAPALPVHYTDRMVAVTDSCFNKSRWFGFSQLGKTAHSQ